jgi:hypothetical protein
MRLDGLTHAMWRTRAEKVASPRSFSMNDINSTPVLLTPPVLVRQALAMNQSDLVEDFLVPLRGETFAGDLVRVGQPDPG